MKWLVALITAVALTGFLMPDRVSASDRIKIANRAEEEIQRYDDNPRWFKHVMNVALDPVQIVKMDLMDRYRKTVDVSCRRTRKTSTKELHALKQAAKEPDHEIGIVGPREAQAKVNLDYHLEGIGKSEILSAYIRYKDGRKQKADTYYQFHNKSISKIYGVMAQVDGFSGTIASLEEIDDMPKDRLYSKFLLAFAGTERLYSTRTEKIEPSIRVTGVYKGLDTLHEMVTGGEYFVLPTIDVHMGMAMGIVDAETIKTIREGLSTDEVKRQLLCLPTEAMNFIWERYIRHGMKLGLQSELTPMPPVPGQQYKKRGLVSLGFDKGAYGESDTASWNCCAVIENWDGVIIPLYVRYWPPTERDEVIKSDLVSIWKYFMPDVAHGDALGATLIGEVNDELWKQRLVQTNRQETLESSATAWDLWAFKPTRMEGMVKHLMFTATQNTIHGERFIMPMLDETNRREPEYASMHRMTQQLLNIKGIKNKSSQSYLSYKMINKQVGDDGADALAFAVWGLVTRGLVAPAVLDMRKTSRAALLGPRRMS